MTVPQRGRTATTKVVELPASERAKLTDAELFDYYRKTSHLGDIEFFLANSDKFLSLQCGVWRDMLSLRARAPRMGKAMVQREYRLILDRYWQAVAAKEREGRQPDRFLGGHWLQPDGNFHFGWKDTKTGHIYRDRKSVEELKAA
jgi:hypothetical protein